MAHQSTLVECQRDRTLGPASSRSSPRPRPRSPGSPPGQTRPGPAAHDRGIARVDHAQPSAERRLVRPDESLEQQETSASDDAGQADEARRGQRRDRSRPTTLQVRNARLTCTQHPRGYALSMTRLKAASASGNQPWPSRRSAARHSGQLATPARRAPPRSTSERAETRKRADLNPSRRHTAGLKRWTKTPQAPEHKSRERRAADQLDARHVGRASGSSTAASKAATVP